MTKASAWVIAILGPLVVSGLLVAIRGDIEPPNTALVLVLVVLGAAIAGGRGPAIASAVVATLCFDFFFTHPYYSLTIDSSDDVETAIVLLVVALAVGELVVRARRSEQRAAASDRQIQQIRRVAELAAGGEPKTRLIDQVQQEIVHVLGARGARFELQPYATTLPLLRHDRVTVLRSGADDVPAGPNNEVALPVWGHGREMGRVVVVLAEPSSGIAVAPADRMLAVTLVDQLGALLATEREAGRGDGE